MVETLLDTQAGPMAPPKKAEKPTAVRITKEAAEWARIAAGYTGESVPEYVSRVIEEQARQDADRLHAEKAKAGVKPKRGGGP